MKGSLAKTVILLVGMYVFLKFILPLFTAPLPASLIFLYLALTLASAMIFYTMSGGSLDEFMGPIGRFLTGDGADGHCRYRPHTGVRAVPVVGGVANVYQTRPKRYAAGGKSNHSSRASGGVCRSGESL